MAASPLLSVAWVAASVIETRTVTGSNIDDPVPPKYSIVLMQLTFRPPRLSIIRHVRFVLVSYRSRYFGVQKSTRAHA